MAIIRTGLCRRRRRRAPRSEAEEPSISPAQIGFLFNPIRWHNQAQCLWFVTASWDLFPSSGLSQTLWLHFLELGLILLSRGVKWCFLSEPLRRFTLTTDLSSVAEWARYIVFCLFLKNGPLPSVHLWSIIVFYLRDNNISFILKDNSWGKCWRTIITEQLLTMFHH